MAEVEDAGLPRRQQLLGGEFRRGVEIAPFGRAVRLDQLGGEGVEMGLVAGRDGKRRAIDLEEVTLGEPGADGGDDAVARQQEGAPVGMAVGREPVGRGGGTGARLLGGWLPEWPLLIPRATKSGNFSRSERRNVVKVIASGVRKGNVIEHEDGKLYVVLKAESMHPGKGTPTTTIDMRRISDGVKTVVRYKTTDPLERAFVETITHSYLYQDGDNYIFMNPENYEQIQVSGDMLGDSAPFLQEGMECQIALFNGAADLDRTAAARDAGDRGDGARHQEPDGVLLLQAGPSLQRRAHHGAAAHRLRHPHRGGDRRRLLRRARQGLRPRPGSQEYSRCQSAAGTSRNRCLPRIRNKVNIT